MSQSHSSGETAPISSDDSCIASLPPFEVRKVVDRVMKDYWDAVQRNWKSPRLHTGIDHLDEVTGGFGTGVHLVAGRPSMGKTALLLSIIQSICVDDNIPCLVFSGDHSALHLTHRLVFSRAWLPTRLTYAVASYPDESEKAALRKAASEISEAPLYVDDSFDLTVESIQQIARQTKADKNIGFIAIENLEMLRTRFTRIELSREREAVEIVARLRGLARELDVPILLIAGLNQGPELRRNLGYPCISDLPHHSLIEGLASTVSLLYRPHYYAACDEDRDRSENTCHMILCKNAHGIQTEIILDYDQTCGRFMADTLLA